MNGRSAVAFLDDRALPRDAVCCRARATHPILGSFGIVVVNISAQGLMARCDKALSEGDRLDVALPIVGRTGAVIRWSLGDRIGCELDHV
ncbi:MAG: hypothetical protein DI607_09960, partial [Sphingomonas hengshuiensis]